MIEIKNQFARNILFWVFTLPLVYVLLAPAIMQADRLKVHGDEILMLKALDRDTEVITRSADEIFTTMFIRTGVYAASKRMLDRPFWVLPGQHPQAVKNADGFNGSYFDGFWHMVYRAIWRVMGLWPVLSVLLLCVVAPAIVDGLVIRGRKLDQFKPHNPVFFWASAHSAISVAGVFVILPLLPVAISLWMLYGCVALIALSLWTTASNLQTGN